ncbi:MAG: 3-dehydroquinate synthase [Deltaproteobacteria bacterium]|nr:3-dehydroquinate synthase [Deltaproteobacteria bacterium]
MSRRPAKPRLAVPRPRSVKVALGERSYSIRLGYGMLADLGEQVARTTGARRAVVITVPEVGRRYAGRVLRSLRAAGLKAERLDVPDGDATKNLKQLGELYTAFLARGLDRSSVVVALGGGVVGDLAGFAAATYLRGIPFVQVPTTVLAMVDASIGGKVAVNLPEGKNLVGAFHQPRLVWIDLEVLRSLPKRQRAAGFAEVVKAGALWDERFFAKLERDAEALMRLDPQRLLPTLQRACAIKAEVVARDEHESGLRMLLNLGHTLGHAVEKLAGYQDILHGEAVAMGMVYAGRRSEQLGVAPAGTAERLEELLRRCNLPTELPRHPRSAYLEALRVDKKSRDSRIRYIVLRRIGKAEALELTAARILPANWDRRG